MISFKNAALVAAACIALTGCARTAPSAADEAAIRAVNPAWFAAYNAGDANAVAALYADDAVLSIPGVAPARGRAAILEALQKDLAASAAAGISNNPGASPEISVAGDLGSEWNTFTVTDKSGVTVDTGKYVTVYAKQDGKWLIIRDIWNTDAPPAMTRSVIVMAKVNDLTKWEEGFRTHVDLFKSQTVQSPVRFAATGDSEVAIVFNVSDLDAYMEGMKSPATAEAMNSDGVKRETVKVFALDKELALD